MSKVLRRAKYFLQRFYALHPGYANLQRSVDETKMLAAKVLINQMREQGVVGSLAEAEFRVFSQFGEDGIIQYLVRHVPIAKRTFVEFGVGKYSEANTRFLLLNDNWRGLVLDGDRYNVNYIKGDPLFWRNDLKTQCAFIDRDNINSLINANGFSGDIGLLSVDIDGNDYWVWESISVVNPAVVIVEYNSVFGYQHAVTIPYDPTFYRYEAHYSGLYWGASLKAFCILAERKGYAFVGSNSAGNNAFFVRKELVGNLEVHSAESGYVESRFRDSRDDNGRFSYLAGNERLKEIEKMTVFDIERNQMVELSAI